MVNRVFMHLPCLPLVRSQSPLFDFFFKKYTFLKLTFREMKGEREVNLKANHQFGYVP